MGMRMRTGERARGTRTAAEDEDVPRHDKATRKGAGPASIRANREAASYAYIGLSSLIDDYN